MRATSSRCGGWWRSTRAWRRPGSRAPGEGRARRCTSRRTGPATFPNGPAVVAVLVEAGAAPDAPAEGRSAVTALRRMAEYLLARGAELNGTPSWGESTPLDAAAGQEAQRELLVSWLRVQGARSGERS